MATGTEQQPGGPAQPESARPRSRLPLWTIVFATVLATIAAVVTYRLLDDGGTSSPDPPAGQVELTPEGEQGPDVERPADEVGALEFQDLGGTTTSLGELAGAPVVVNFFASWCAPCLIEMPAFERVHQDLGDQVTFLGLAVRDRPEDVHRIVDDTGVTYRIGRDLDDRVLTALGALGGLPATALLDETGALVEVRRGELDEQQLRSLIEERLGVPS